MKLTTDSSLLALCLVAGSFSAPAIAQEKTQNHSNHNDVEEIIVSSDPIGRAKGALAQGISVIEGDRLERSKGLTLGATLDKLPGISQSSFGPAASRPIIRGLGGDRIRILTAGIGSIDASATSPDHAVAIDPETAESIEVLRGPATLLFGNNAVGGVVNIFDGRIPSKRSETTTGLIKAGYGTNGNEASSSLWVDGPLGDKMAYHVDFSMMDRGLMSIPGYAESAALRAFEDAEHEDGDDHDDDHDEDGHEEHGGLGIAESTDTSKVSGSAGVTYFSGNGFLGISFSGLGTKYGVPGHHHAGEEDEDEDHDDHDEEGSTSIDLKQYRADLMGEWRFDDGIVDTLRIRYGYADYEHTELEGNEIGTSFFNKGYEGRLEARMRESGNMSGAFGLQFKHRDFSAIGEESFVPKNITNQWGLFMLNSWQKGGLTLEAGARVEGQTIKADSIGFNKEFTSTSFSGSAVQSLNNGWKLAVTGFRTERAPNAEELLSNGPHLATGTYELGNPNLDKETARGLEASFRQVEGEITGSVSVFYTHYDDFIFQKLHAEDHDEEEDGHEDHNHGLPEAEYTATNASFWGIEGEINWHLLESDKGWFELHAGFDMVRATNLAHNEPLPRIPPISLNVGGEWSGDKFDYGADVTFSRKQNRLTPEEFITSGFVDASAHITYRPQGTSSPLAFTLTARNLFNDEIRHHTSFTKDLLPEAGRDVRIAMKYSF